MASGEGSRMNSTAIGGTDRSAFPVSPIAAVDSRLARHRRRGPSPLLRSGSDPSLTHSSVRPHVASAANAEPSAAGESLEAESGYGTSSWARLGGASARSPLSNSCEPSTSELKLSQLQGTSTPRSRLAAADYERSVLASARASSNPFEACLIDSLCTNTFSPSVFAKVVSPSSNDTAKSGDFRWSIDRIAVMNPAEIDEGAEHDHAAFDSETESVIQAALSQFWTSQSHIVPSPPVEAAVRSRIRKQAAAAGYAAVAASPMAVATTHSHSTESQTLLTFPPSLDLVRLLGGCFQYGEDEAAAVNMSVSSLRRKLFAACPSDELPTSAPANASTLSGNDDEFDGSYDCLDAELSVAPRRLASRSSEGAPFSSPDVSPIRDTDNSLDTHRTPLRPLN